MIEQVIVPLSADRDFQRVHGGEIRGRQVAGLVDLWKDDFFSTAVLRTPNAHSPLECSPLRIGELPGVLLFQPLE